MRQNIKSLAPVLWIVIAAFILTIFGVWGGGIIEDSGITGEDTVAAVGKTKISAESYYSNLRQRLEMMKNQFKDINKNLILQLNIPGQVLEQLIQQTILLQVAKEMGIHAYDEEIRKKIINYPVFQKEGKFIGFDEYKKILDWNRIPVSTFEQSLEKEILIDKVIKTLSVGIAVSEQEMWNYFKKENETARLEYVLLEIDKLDISETPEKNELREFFRKNKSKYRLPERREGKIVFLNTSSLKNEVELTDAEIKKYYKDNLDKFREPEKIKVSRIYLSFEGKEKEEVTKKAESIMNNLKTGQDFTEMAKKYSEDVKAEVGGNWGLYEWKSLSSKEQDEINQLSEGEISGILELEDGISIIKITEKEPSRIKSIEETRGLIENILLDENSREIAEDRLMRLKKRAEKEKNLSSAAENMGLEAKSTGLLKEGEAYEDKDSSGAVSQTLFSLKKKEVSSPIYTYSGIAIVQLINMEPPRKAKYNEVEKEVRSDFIKEMKKEKGKEILKKARKESLRTNLEQIASLYDLEYKTVNEHKRGQYLSILEENPEFDKLAFSIPLNKLSEVLQFGNNLVLLKVLDRKEATRSEFQKQRNSVKEQLLEEKKNRFLQSYLSSMKEERKVRINSELVQKIQTDILSRYEAE